MDRVGDDLHALEAAADERAQELVVIAGNINHARAGAGALEQMAHDRAMRGLPPPAVAQPPAVDDVADEVIDVRLVAREHVERQFRLATAGAQMQVGYEQRGQPPRRR